MTYFNAGYMAEALGMSLFHYVLALSSYVRGYLGDYSPSLWGRGQLVGQALLPFLSFLYRLPTNIL